MQGGLRLTPGAFFCNWFATVLATLVAQSFGLLIGATVMNAKTAQTVTAVIMLTMMLGAHTRFPGGCAAMSGLRVSDEAHLEPLKYCLSH